MSEDNRCLKTTDAEITAFSLLSHRHFGCEASLVLGAVPAGIGSYRCLKITDV